MANLTSQIRHYLKKDYPDMKEIPPASVPVWFQESRWTPALCLYSKQKNMYLAAAIQLSGLLPITFFREQVAPLLKKYNDKLRIIICVPEKGLFAYPETEKFCIEMGFGLKTLEPNLGLIIVVKTDLDPQEQTPIQQEIGFFPKAIIGRAVGLQKLMFSELIEGFTEEITAVQKSENKIIEKTRKLVITTINKLLSKHPSFKGNIGQFMQLAHFEKLLQLASPASSEHIFHSFRVFLAGCPIINANYDHFVKAHKMYSVSCKRTEYSQGGPVPGF